MKICITSQGKTLDSEVDSRFGRCKNFIIVDTETDAFEVLENAHATFQGGAGIQSAQFVASKGVKAILTGNVGPNAFQTLNAAGIEIYVGVSGIVSEAVKQYKTGKLTAAKDSSVGSKFGMGK
ncbi:MAG: NifB/NifX family molybdenum-iron cluster-binding protein [Candidatus Omnitrophota bacterium]